MKRLKVLACAAISLLAVAASCDYIAGISRTAHIQTMPPPACIESAISSVDAVESVRHEVREGGRPLTLTGITPAETVHYFFYTTKRGGAALHVVIDYKGDTELVQSLFAVNQTPSQDDVDAIRPVMMRVERALEAQCGLASLSASVRESCSGVECKAE